MKGQRRLLLTLRNGIKLLWNAAPWYLIGIVFLSSLSGLIVPLNTLVWKYFLDVISQVFMSYVWSNTILILLLFLSLITIINYILNTVLQYIKQTFSDKLDLYVTDIVLSKSLSFPMEVYDNSETYNQLNMAITKTSQQCFSLLDTVSEIVYAVVQITGIIAIIVQYSWLVVFLSFFSAIPLAMVSIKANTYWYSVFMKRIEKLRLINYLKVIMVKNENLKEIKLFRVGEKIANLIHTNYTSFIQNDKNARKKISVKRTFAQIFDEIVSIGVKIWILIISIKNLSSIGTVVMFFNTQTNLKNAITMFLNQVSNLHNSSLYLQSIQNIDTFPKICDEGKRSFSGDFSKIEFVDVSFKYPNSESYVLEHVSLKFEMGKTYSIVGFNGSGKTTLIKLLLKLYVPTSGAIYIDGVNLQEYQTTSYYQHISAVFQDFIKYPFTVEENIDVCSSEATKQDVQQAGQLADADTFIKNLPNGYDTILMKEWENGVDISQGQWQKIAIARCLCRKSSIAVLDEPFSSLDADAENRIVGNFRNVRKDNLNIIITHRFSSISLADEIIVLENGRVTEKGSHVELLNKKGTYSLLYKAQMLFV